MLRTTKGHLVAAPQTCMGYWGDVLILHGLWLESADQPQVQVQSGDCAVAWSRLGATAF